MTDRICILGGCGFVGARLVIALAEQGHIVRVPTRNKSLNHPLTSTDGVEVCQADIHDSDTLNQLTTGCRAVINLVGILNEQTSDGSGFHHAHVNLTEKVIRACEHNEIPRLLHMSALHADADKGPSHYLFSKGKAQELVANANRHGLATTWFCPSIIYGPGDSFFNRFATLLKFAPVFPLACPDARFAPVYVEDVVRSFVRSLDDNETVANGYNLCGPKIYTLKQLVEYTARTCNMKRIVIGLNDTLSRLQAHSLGLVPGKPMSYDNYLSLQVDSVCETGFPERFGTATVLEDIVPAYLYRQ